MPAWSFPPRAAFSDFLEFSKLFPQIKILGGYLLNYLDEKEVNKVDSFLGSCMFICQQMLQQIGELDERFYLLDIDGCFDAKKAGWKIIYLPTAQIIQFGGQGGSRV